MRAGIITKLYRSPCLTHVFLDYYRWLNVRDTTFVRSAAVSTDVDPHVDDAMALFSKFYVFTDAPNDCLGDKTNAAALMLRGHDVDFVINVGSDDFVTPAYVEQVGAMIAEGADYIVPAEVYFYEPATHRAFVQRRNHGLKAGAVISRRLLDKVDWCPCLPGHHLPDIGMDLQLKPHATPVYLTPNAPAVLDVKAEQSLSSFDEARTSNRFTEDVTSELVFEQFPDLLTSIRHAGLSGVTVAT